MLICRETSGDDREHSREYSHGVLEHHIIPRYHGKIHGSPQSLRPTYQWSRRYRSRRVYLSRRYFWILLSRAMRGIRVLRLQLIAWPDRTREASVSTDRSRVREGRGDSRVGFRGNRRMSHEKPPRFPVPSRLSFYLVPAWETTDNYQSR